MTDFPAPPPSQWSSSAPPSPEPQRRGWAFGSQLADWPRRTLATLIDFAVTMWLPILIFGGMLEFLVILALVGGNSVFMQSRTGQSLGKVLLGVQLVWPVRGADHGPLAAYPPPGRCAVRVPLHALDLMLFIGFLRPLWHRRHQTFADSLTKTLVLAGRPMVNLEPAPPSARSLLM